MVDGFTLPTNSRALSTAVNSSMALILGQKSSDTFQQLRIILRLAAKGYARCGGEGPETDGRIFGDLRDEADRRLRMGGKKAQHFRLPLPAFKCFGQPGQHLR